MNGSVTLKRSLSLPMLVLYGLGTTIGAGIYALIGEIAGVAGYLAPFSFLLAALLAGVTDTPALSKIPGAKNMLYAAVAATARSRPIIWGRCRNRSMPSGSI